MSSTWKQGRYLCVLTGFLSACGGGSAEAPANGVPMRMMYAVGSPNTPLYADAQASAAIGWLVEGVPVELRSPVRNGRVRITVRRELTLNAWVDAGQLSADYVPVRPASSRLLDYEGDKYGEVIRLAANTHLFARPHERDSRKLLPPTVGLPLLEACGEALLEVVSQIKALDAARTRP